MIGSLHGTISHVGDTYIIVDVGGVGYHVYLSPRECAGLHDGDDLQVWTHLAVRENALDLYGFKTRPEVGFFELLLGVSGIGPKTALSILGVADIATLQRAVVSGDTSHLTKVSGIGTKNAQKIVLELKDKLESGDHELGESTSEHDGDVLDALGALGYSREEAREALRQVPTETETTEERIRSALKYLTT